MGMEEAARKVVRYLYDGLRGKASNQQRSCVLVRFFKTQLYADLPKELREWAAAGATSAPLGGDSLCLTLLATAGDEPQWNSPRTSAMHRCVPLQSESIIEEFPMISQLIQQMGLKTAEFVRKTPAFINDFSKKNFGVLFVPVANGSPFVPAQSQFVVAYGVKSVLGFGGMFPMGVCSP